MTEAETGVPRMRAEEGRRWPRGRGRGEAGDRFSLGASRKQPAPPRPRVWIFSSRASAAMGNQHISLHRLGSDPARPLAGPTAWAFSLALC